jgi:hypothetical protein
MADLRERVETVLATAGGGMIDGYLALNVISIWGGYVRRESDCGNPAPAAYAVTRTGAEPLETPYNV